MTILQIRSLRQLILGSFFLALIPLIVLLWQSQRDLALVGKMTAQEAQYFISTVESVKRLDSMASDIERLILQHFVLKNVTLKSLVDESLFLFSSRLTPFCDSLQHSKACSRLPNQVNKLQNYESTTDRQVLYAHLDAFKREMDKLGVEVSGIISHRQMKQEEFLTSLQQKQAWSTAVLVLVSLIATAFGSQFIIKPVNRIKRIITAIATNQKNLPARSGSGPNELMAVEKDLYWLSDRLQQLEKVRIALLRHASHELKTPLASIKQGCSILSENLVGPLNTKQGEVVNLLNSSTQRLSILIERLLDYNALLQQAEPLARSIKPSKVIQDCIRDNSLAMNQNNHEVDTQVMVQNIEVDVELFRRVLDNLLSNAFAHGTPNSKIFIKLFEDKHYWILECANRGKGISEEMKAEIFEPFRRGAEPRNDSVIGAGLGLSIVSDCARLMDGDVNLVNVDYADVCFRVRMARSGAERAPI